MSIYFFWLSAYHIELDFMPKNVHFNGLMLSRALYKKSFLSLLDFWVQKCKYHFFIEFKYRWFQTRLAFKKSPNT